MRSPPSRTTSSVRAVVLAANGPAFSAGHDLKELYGHRADDDGGRAYFKHIMAMCSAMMQQIVALPQPVIAAVQATATAAGCQLVASCDLAVASRTAKFATPGINVGLFCSTPMVALSRNVIAQACDGDAAHRRHDLGRARRTHRSRQPRGRRREPSVKKRSSLPKKSPRNRSATVRIGKEAFYRQLEMPLAEAYKYTSEVMVENLLARDAEEGIGAFIEKRKPKWEDR